MHAGMEPGIMARPHDDNRLHLAPDQRLVADGGGLPGKLVASVWADQALESCDPMLRRVFQQRVEGLGQHCRIAGIEQAGDRGFAHTAGRLRGRGRVGSVGGGGIAGAASGRAPQP